MQYLNFYIIVKGVNVVQKELTQLHLGEMTNAELAEWFGITERTLRNTKSKKLEVLKEYADFEASRGKVNILHIYKPYYTKGSKNYAIIKASTKKLWEKEELSTGKAIWEKTKKTKGEKLDINDSTGYQYTCQSRTELWGKPYGRHGEIGYCTCELAKKCGDQIVPLNAEEQQLKKELIKKFFGNIEEKQLYVKNLVDEGKLTKEEAWSVLEEITGMDDHNYMSFLRELEIACGAAIVRATRVITNELDAIVETE